MAIKKADIDYTIGADSSQAENSMKSFKNSVDKNTEDIKTTLKTLSVAFTGLGLAVAGTVKLYETQFQAEKRLEAVLKATDNQIGLNAKELKNMASELQNIIGVGDEVILNAQSILLTFKKVNKEAFRETIVLAQDMANVFGGDLNNHIKSLGIALNDPIQGYTRLRRIGVSFTDSQVEQIKTLTEANDIMGAQRVILDELQSEIGGTSKLMNDTWSGDLNNAKNAFGDLLEIVGKQFTPIIGVVSKEIFTFIKNTENIKIIEMAADNFFKTFENGLIFISDNIKIISSLSLAFVTLGTSVGRTITIFMGLKASLQDIFGAWQGFTTLVKNEAMNTMLKDVAQKLTDNVTKLKDIKKATVDYQMELDKLNNLRHIGHVLTNEEIDRKQFLMIQLKGINNLRNETVNKIDQLKEKQKELLEADKKLNSETNSVTNEIKKNGSEINKLIESLGNLAVGIDNLQPEKYTNKIKEIFEKAEEIKQESILKEYDLYGQQSDNLLELSRQEKEFDNELLINSNEYKLEKLAEYHERYIEEKNRLTNILQESDFLQLAQKEAIFEKELKAEIIAEEKANKIKIKNKKMFYSYLEGMANSNNKALSAIGKTYAAIKIVQDTQQAAMGAYSALASIPYVGPALGVAAAAAAIAYGAERLSNLNSDTIGSGGGTTVSSTGSISASNTTPITTQESGQTVQIVVMDNMGRLQEANEDTKMWVEDVILPTMQEIQNDTNQNILVG